MARDRRDDRCGQVSAGLLRIGSAAGALADEALDGKSLGTGIGRVEQSLDLGMDPVRLVDEELPGAEAAGVVGEPQVGDDHGEELLVEQAAGQVKPPAPLADQVEVDLVGRAVPVGPQPIARRIRGRSA